MTDATPKKRAWFQLHLSKCVVLMFVAGAIMFLNGREMQHGSNLDRITVIGSKIDLSEGFNNSDEMEVPSIVKYTHVMKVSMGWPASMKEMRFEHVREREVRAKLGDPYFRNPADRFKGEEESAIIPLSVMELGSTRWLAVGVIVNFLVGLASFVLAAVACEYFLRRRARRKQSA